MAKHLEPENRDTIVDALDEIDECVKILEVAELALRERRNAYEETQIVGQVVAWTSARIDRARDKIRQATH